MGSLTVAVVICAYTLERWDDLVLSARSAAEQSPPPDEIWLVVDHSDALLARAQGELQPMLKSLRVVENSRRRGLSGARNTALEHVQTDLVVFLDDDAAAEPDWLAHLVAPYDDASVIAVGGAAAPRWPEFRSRPSTLPAPADGMRGELDWVVGCTYQGQPTTLQPVRNLMGCNMSFRRRVFDQVGGFGEDLGRVGKVPLGCEETELCIRALQANPGAGILFEPRASVRHHVSTDRLTWSYLRRRCYAEGLSKAAVAGLVGQHKALETERRYVAETLPRGLRRELWEAARDPRHAGARAARASAIVAAVAATGVGYARGRLSGVRVRPGASPDAAGSVRTPAPRGRAAG